MAERAKAGDGNVKILLPETELQGFARRGGAKRKSRRAAERSKSGGEPAAEM